MQFDSEGRRLALQVRENFVSDDNLVLSLKGTINTVDGRVDSEVLLKKKLFSEKVLTRLDIGALFRSKEDEIQYYVAAKKKVELSDDGLTLLEAKASYHFRPAKYRGDFRGAVQLSQKIFNFTEDQDLKLKLGYDAGNRNFFAKIRENNWSLNTNTTGYWGVSYDL